MTVTEVPTKLTKIEWKLILSYPWSPPYRAVLEEIRRKENEPVHIDRLMQVAPGFTYGKRGSINQVFLAKKWPFFLHNANPKSMNACLYATLYIARRIEE